MSFEIKEQTTRKYSLFGAAIDWVFWTSCWRSLSRSQSTKILSSHATTGYKSPDQVKPYLLHSQFSRRKVKYFTQRLSTRKWAWNCCCAWRAALSWFFHQKDHTVSPYRLFIYYKAYNNTIISSICKLCMTSIAHPKFCCFIHRSYSA